MFREAQLNTVISITPEKSTTRFRLDSIDFLRGIAVLAVGMYHVWGHDGTYPWYSIGVVTTSPDPHWLSYLTFPFRWGYLGVGLFLVLSGFCIHLPLARKGATGEEPRLQLRAFFLRRIWRLYPAYFVAVVGTTLLLIVASRFPWLHVAEHHSVPTMFDLLSHLTLTHGFFESSFYSITSVFWSLALEFQLYLAYPLFLLLFRKIGTGKSIALLTVVSLIWRFLSLEAGQGLISVAAHGPYAAMGSVLARMPEWLLGAWLAELYCAGKLRALKPLTTATFAISLFGAAIVSTLDQRLWLLTDPLFGASFAAIVLFALNKESAAMQPQRGALSLRLQRSVIRLGVISYTVYLLHMQLSWFYETLWTRVPGLLLPFAGRTLSLLLSIYILDKVFRFIEKPFLRSPRKESVFYAPYAAIQDILGIKTESIPTVAAEV